MVKSSTQAQIRYLERERAQLVKQIAGREKSVAALDAKLTGSLLPSQRARLEEQREATAKWIPTHRERLTQLDQTLAQLRSEAQNA